MADLTTSADIDRALDGLIANRGAALLTSIPGAPVADLLGRGFGRLTRAEHLERAHAVVRAKRLSAAHLANQWKGKTLIIVGSGPSLTETQHDLHDRIHDCRKDVVVMALNKTHDWLIQGERRGRNTWNRYPIIPEFAMMLDPKPWCATYMTPHPKPLYLFGSGIDQDVWDKFDTHNAKNPNTPSRMFWFYPMHDQEGELEANAKSDADELIQTHNLNTVAVIAGGSNVGLRAINIALMLGCDAKVELWGYDSCYAPGGYVTQTGLGGAKLYAFDKPNVEHNARGFDIEAPDRSRLFVIANEAMQRQVVQFARVVNEIEDLRPGKNPTIDRLNVWKAWVNGDAKHTGVMKQPLKICVAGDGAIPWMAWKDGGPDRVLEHLYPERMKAKYGDSRYWNYSNNGVVKGDIDLSWMMEPAA